MGFFVISTSLRVEGNSNFCTSCNDSEWLPLNMVRNVSLLPCVYTISCWWEGIPYPCSRIFCVPKSHAFTQFPVDEKESPIHAPESSVFPKSHWSWQNRNAGPSNLTLLPLEIFLPLNFQDDVQCFSSQAQSGFWFCRWRFSRLSPCWWYSESPNCSREHNFFQRKFLMALHW